MSKIKKVKDTFVFINDDGIKMGTMNIKTEKFVGATLCHLALYEHIQNYKITNLEYVKEEIRKTKEALDQAGSVYFLCLEEFQALEKLEKELEEKCNAEINKIV